MKRKLPELKDPKSPIDLWRDAYKYSNVEDKASSLRDHISSGRLDAENQKAINLLLLELLEEAIRENKELHTRVDNRISRMRISEGECE